MKPLNLVVLIICCFTTSNLIAQTPKQIEDDLLKSFKKIDPGMNDNSEANDQFAKKLYNYASHHPATISYSFVSLKKEHLDINTSDDGFFRIYSWDTWSGDTMHFFENVIQYNSGTTVTAIIDKPDGEAVSNYNYNKVYSLRINNQVYYLARYLMIGSTKDLSDGIHIFTINSGRLADAKIIKTHSGLHSELSYEYDLSHTSEKVNAEIHFDANTKSIYIPVVLEQGRLTNNYIVYKFTGQYFERVKN